MHDEKAHLCIFFFVTVDHSNQCMQESSLANRRPLEAGAYNLHLSPDSKSSNFPTFCMDEVYLACLLVFHNSNQFIRLHRFLSRAARMNDLVKDSICSHKERLKNWTAVTQFELL
uniref:AlNc14C34G3072 protein n=1 Tax=Albugo laibachii Nc14 TaxID=890382 RepID=F0W8E2_9STRA|nr:AlNc14C34G3072 [Albugo laibachii Nc14]|eukprot:CCA17397.1 AlNc14C34G3072 [Albugo laibachii Nc14]